MPQREPETVSAREVCFWLYRGKQRVLDGRFVATAEVGVSTFGEYREFEVAGFERAIGLFQGVIIEHELQADGSASIDLQYYVVEPDAQSPLGYTQTRDIKAGISMGADSGMDEVETVALGPEYELAFRCHRIA